MSYSPGGGASGGIQERISAPRGIGGRQIRTNLRTVPARPTVRPTVAASPSGALGGDPFFGGLTKDGLIQERIQWPARTGTEVMRTVASRVVDHVPSHYAMLGVPKNFSEQQLRKQYRLLARRYHPDNATRNGIDPDEAIERFRSMQTAYDVLSDPQKRWRYDIDQRLRHRREWRRAWGAPQILDHSGGEGEMAAEGEQQHEEEAEQHAKQQQGGEAEPPPAEHGAQGEEDEPDLEETPAQRWERERAEKARRWDAERLAWLQSQIERQEAQLSRGGGRASSGDDGGMEGRLREAKHDEAEARARAAEAERALRQAKDKARRKAHEARLRREAEEAARIEQMERTQREDEERAVEVEARVRRQVEERARRQGAEAARREAAEAVLAAEERARLATLAAEEKAIRLQAELTQLQRRLEEAERSAAVPPPPGGHPGGAGEGAIERAAEGDEEDEDEDEEQVEHAVAAVEAAYREELAEREWERRAVSAAGDLPDIPDGHTLLSATAVGSIEGEGGGGEGSAALNELVKWVCINVPAGSGMRRRSVLMDTPYGRFAVLIPSGLAPGTPLLVPVPASGAPTQIGSTVTNDPAVRKKEEAREAQLAALVERGFAPSEAAQYCDGTSSIEELVELMSSDEHALAQQASEDDDGLEDDADAGLVPAPSKRGGSNFCTVQ